MTNETAEDHLERWVNDSLRNNRGTLDVAGMEYENGRIQFSLTEFFNESVCVPLVKWVNEQVEQGIGNVSAKSSSRNISVRPGVAGHDGSRRLASVMPPFMDSLTPTVLRWWQAHPGDPEAKLLIVRLALEQLRRDVHRLLVKAPRAVGNSIRHHGPGPALDLALSHYVETNALDGSLLHFASAMAQPPKVEL